MEENKGQNAKETTIVEESVVEEKNTNEVEILSKEETKPMRNLSIGVVSLGCDKNRVDTETMLSMLLSDGYSYTSDPSEANILIVNTCGFLKSARNEAYEIIEDMMTYRKSGKCVCMVVTGCIPQKYMNEVTGYFPDVDIFLGTNEYKDICKILEKYIVTGEKIRKNDSPYNLHSVEQNRIITTPNYYAFVKIADGCDKFCTYCTIPYIRGRYRSRKIENIVCETQSLVENGVKEIILVAQDIACYGVDLYNKKSLCDLLGKLVQIEKLKKIRLLYCYPENIDEELLDFMIENPKIYNYLDLPLQHVNDKILKLMNRKSNKSQIVELINNIRKKDPEFAIRTTFMVGFPGETEEQFKVLLEFIKDFKLTNVGAFAYSKEEGTVAGRMENQVPEKIKRRRYKKLMKTQRKIVLSENKKKNRKDFWSPLWRHSKQQYAFW